MTGTRILDIGPGGSLLLDLIEKERPDAKPLGLDISVNVIEALKRKKHSEGHRWDVIKGDALRLEEFVEAESMDTVIFSSILHELYSYIERDGTRFNPQTVATALQSAYRVLAPGGRIIIRDGIMTEPAEQRRRIRFLEQDGMEWLLRGYFTPSQYEECIRSTLGPQAMIRVSRHYLQEGYTDALSGRIELTDEQGQPVPLLDSTCLIVIEKPQ